MTNPDKIYAWPFMAGAKFERTKGGWNDTPGKGEVEYVRKDSEAIAAMIWPLVWDRSNVGITWDGDYHSLPTKYTIRGNGDGTYRMRHIGGFGNYPSPEEAKAAAQAHHVAQVMAALGLDEHTETTQEDAT